MINESLTNNKNTNSSRIGFGEKSFSLGRYDDFTSSDMPSSNERRDGTDHMCPVVHYLISRKYGIYLLWI